MGKITIRKFCTKQFSNSGRKKLSNTKFSLFTYLFYINAIKQSTTKSRCICISFNSVQQLTVFCVCCFVMIVISNTRTISEAIVFTLELGVNLFCLNDVTGDRLIHKPSVADGKSRWGTYRARNYCGCHLHSDS